MRVIVQNCATGETIERDATAEEETAITTVTPPDPRLVLDAEEAAAAKADNEITTFLNGTENQLENWLDINVDGAPDLAALKVAVHKIGSVLGRIAINAARGRVLR